ncbi:MAG: ribonuclease III [Magnetococcus sp. DMHC-6]
MESSDQGPGIEVALEALTQRFGYIFSDSTFLIHALTHRSCSIQENVKSADETLMPVLPVQEHNERLEFLGDAVLDLLISNMLYHYYPEVAEGRLSQWRSTLVNTHSLGKIAKDFDVGALIHLGRGEEMSGGRCKSSILGNTLEAIIGAIFLDGGFNAVQQVVHHIFAPLVAQLEPSGVGKDYKSLLQEHLQAQGIALPTYQVVTIEGAPHERLFSVACQVDFSSTPFSGQGRTKREAEQEAARNALAELKFLLDIEKT